MLWSNARNCMLGWGFSHSEALTAMKISSCTQIDGAIHVSHPEDVLKISPQNKVLFEELGTARISELLSHSLPVSEFDAQ